MLDAINNVTFCGTRTKAVKNGAKKVQGYVSPRTAREAARYEHALKREYIRGCIESRFLEIIDKFLDIFRKRPMI